MSLLTVNTLLYVDVVVLIVSMDQDGDHRRRAKFGWVEAYFASLRIARETNSSTRDDV